MLSCAKRAEVMIKEYGESVGTVAALRARIAALEQALRKLRNEVHGSLYMNEPEMRQVIGNTNFQCIELRLREAEALLPSQSETIAKPTNWFDAGYLENGHCSFMQAMNGWHYCCRLPHAHDGPHVADDGHTSKTGAKP
jgi:hypothetical protein